MKSFMARTRLMSVVSLTCLLSVHYASAQDLSRYRGYTLGSSTTAVVRTGGLSDADITTLHTRPARIQEVEWRAPYVSSQSVKPDPVHDVRFTFVDDQLYRVVVTYERDRMEGLTPGDLTELLSGAYGVPVQTPSLASGRGRGRATAPPADAGIMTRWEDAASVVTLERDRDSMRFQLVMVSKALDVKARTAITEAVRLDALEAPQREVERRKADAAATRLKDEEKRAINKASFRP